MRFGWKIWKRLVSGHCLLLPHSFHWNYFFDRVLNSKLWFHSRDLRFQENKPKRYLLLQTCAEDAELQMISFHCNLCFVASQHHIHNRAVFPVSLELGLYSDALNMCKQTRWRHGHVWFKFHSVHLNYFPPVWLSLSPALCCFLLLCLPVWSRRSESQSRKRSQVSSSIILCLLSIPFTSWPVY